MTLYYVHNDLRHQVNVFYSLEEAEHNSDQYCHITHIDFKDDVLMAYEAGCEKLHDSPNYFHDLLVGQT